MKPNKITKRRTMDFTNHTYREAVNRLKYLLAESYTPIKSSYGYSRHDDSADDQSDIQSVSIKGMERPALSEISKYLSPSYRSGLRNTTRRLKTYSPLSKENLSVPTYAQTSDYLASPQSVAIDAIQAPPEILNFIEKQEDYIEQLEKESSFCRNELSNLLGKVKDVINENEILTEHAKFDFTNKNSSSSESEEKYEKVTRKKDKSNRHNLGGPNIVFESRISELEAELTQTKIDLKKIRTENEELKRKIAFSSGNSDDYGTGDALRKQVENLQRDKLNLEEQIRKFQKTVENLRSDSSNYASKKHREIMDMAVFEKTQAEMEIKHLRDELERQHERIRELQHEMARRISEERSNAERRYNFQVDQLGGDLNCQWDHVSKLQIDLERQKRIESDLKRDLAQRNAQIDDLKEELKSKRANFLSDIGQLNAEKQSLEQDAASLRLQLEKSERQAKVEIARLNAEINSLRQRLDRADADLLHAKRENLRLSDEIANLEKEVTLGEMKNEVRPTTRDLNKTISEMQQKHEGTVRELEDMIQSQRQLMDKLTNECKTLTSKLEDTTLKHNQEKKELRRTNEMLLERLRQIWAYYKKLNAIVDETKNLSNNSNNMDSFREEQNKNKNKRCQHQSIPMNHKSAQPMTTESQKFPTIKKENNLHPRETSLMISRPPPQTSQALEPKLVSPQMKNKLSHQHMSMETMKISKIDLEKKMNSEIKKNSTPYSQKKMLSPQRTQKINNIQHSSHQNQIIPVDTKAVMEIQDTCNKTILEEHMNQITVSHMISNIQSTKAVNNIKINSTQINNTKEMSNTRHIPQLNSNQPMNQNMNKSINLSLVVTSSHLQSQLKDQNNQKLQQSQASRHQRRQDRQQSNEKAVFNRERAIELWGLQVQEEVEQKKGQTFCRNSLPRPLKNYLPQEPSEDEFHSYNRIPEFDISSPSLFEKSSDSDCSSELTQSLPTTAIQRTL